MSATDGGSLDEPLAPSGARHRRIDGPRRADLVTTLPLGDLADVDDDLVALAFETEQEAR